MQALGASMKRHIQLRPELESEFHREMAALGIKKSKVVGVHIRGTTFRSRRLYGHSVPLEATDFFEPIDHALENGFEKIFLATDDTHHLLALRERYGNRVLFYADVFRSDDNVDVTQAWSARKNHGYYLGREVLRDVYTLSNCDALISGISQVPFMARVQKYAQNEAYEFVQTIDKGVNKKTHLLLELKYKRELMKQAKKEQK